HGTATVVNPRYAGVVSTVLVKSVVVLFVTDFEGMAAHHFRKSDRAIFRLINERIELRSAHVGESTYVQHGGNVACSARGIIDDQRIETPGRGVNVGIGI